MKSKKMYIFLVLLVAIFAPIFCGCTVDTSITLRTPASVEYQVTDYNGRQIIFVESNPFASAYLFGIGENESTPPEDFVKYQNVANVDGKEQNFLDVTNIFKDNKTYYFYAQYIGSGIYKSSKISPISKLVLNNKLIAPTLYINSTTLNWEAVPHASTYSVYATINDATETVAEALTGTSFDFSTWINNKISAGLNLPVYFTVCADATSDNIKSANSNAVLYTEFLKLATPTNLSVRVSGDRRILSWTTVAYCSSYSLVVNDSEPITLTRNDFSVSGTTASYDITALYTQLGEYQIKLQAVGAEYYRDSEFSEICTDTYAQKLSTVQNVAVTDNSKVEANTIIVSWDAVENANCYELYYSQGASTNPTKFVLNGTSGVGGTIQATSILLSYSQVGATGFNSFYSHTICIYLKAVGTGYYTDSDLSSGSYQFFSDKVDLTSVTIADDADAKTISWGASPNATRYSVFIQGPNESVEQQTTELSFYYGDFITSAGKYSIYCVAYGRDGESTSPSNTIEKETYVKLSAPSISAISLEDTDLNVQFAGSAGGSTYCIYVAGNLIDDNVSGTSTVLDLKDVSRYKQNGQLAISMSANANGYYLASDISGESTFSLVLDPTTISIIGSTLSWPAVENATGYKLYLDDVSQTISTTQTSLNLTNYVGVDVARQVRICATNPYMEDSALSNCLYYNRASQTHAGYTDKYFYNGQTYDYYITSDAEMFDIIEYTFLNRIASVSMYINYGTDSIVNKISNAVNGLTGTRNFTYSISYYNSTNGEAQVTFSYASISSAPNYSPSTSQYANDMVYNFQSDRTSSYKFASDDYIVSQDVSTTDGLLKAIQNHATPKFTTKNSMAERVYNKAKNILTKICDDDMSDYEKALAIHDYIVENVAYDTYGLNSVSSDKLGYFHYIESAMMYNLAVCDGYAKMFALLCNMEGIDCLVVSGLADKSDSSSGHAWNKISFDYDDDGQKEWFVVDCTFDDGSDGTTEYLSHEYFLCTDNDIGLPDSQPNGRSEDANATWPATTESSEMFYGYYTLDGMPLKIDSASAFEALRTYIQTHDTYKLEVLMTRTYYNQLYWPHIAFTSSMQSGYYRVYIYNTAD